MISFGANSLLRWHCYLHLKLQFLTNLTLLAAVFVFQRLFNTGTGSAHIPSNMVAYFPKRSWFQFDVLLHLTARNNIFARYAPLEVFHCLALTPFLRVEQLNTFPAVCLFQSDV